MNFKKQITAIYLFIPIALSWQCGSNTKSAEEENAQEQRQIPTFELKMDAVTDIDGNTYNTVVIDSNEWFAENLRVTRLNNGKQLEFVAEKKDWGGFDLKYCWPNYDSAFKDTYGIYYNHFVVKSDSLCPCGWHVPTMEEWRDGIWLYFMDELRDTLFNENLRSKTGWKWPLECYNKYNFNVFPSAYVDEEGEVWDFNNCALFWTSTSNGAPPRAAVFTTGGTMAIRMVDRRSGLTIRCVKDKEAEEVPKKEVTSEPDEF